MLLALAAAAFLSGVAAPVLDRVHGGSMSTENMPDCGNAPPIVAKSWQ